MITNGPSILVLCAALIFGSAISLAADLGDPLDLSGSAIRNLDADVRDRFLRDAPPAWQALKTNLANSQVTFRSKSSSSVYPEPSVWDGLCCVGPNPGEMLVYCDGKSQTFASNPRYSFAVNRKTPDAQYALEQTRPVVEGNRMLAAAELQEGRIYLESMWSVWWVPLDYILNGGRFEWIGAQNETTSTGEEVVRIAFRCIEEAPTRLDYLCAKGAIYWAELLPAKNWIVLRSGVEGVVTRNRTVHNLVQITYQQGLNDLPFPAKYVLQTIDDKTKQVIDQRETTFDAPQPLTRTAAEFYLPHYGIAEIAVPTLGEPGLPGRIVLIIAGIIGIVVALFLLRATRRPAPQ